MKPKESCNLSPEDRVYVDYEGPGTVVRVLADGIDVRIDHDGETVNAAKRQVHPLIQLG